MEPNSTTDPFQQEIIALFAAEAQEWISQVESALHELETGPPQFRSAKLFETIRNGITNLGGSAATVERPDIEKLAYAMLPHLEAIEGQGRISSAGQCAALRESLEHLAMALQRLIPSPAYPVGAQPAGAPASRTAPAPAPAATGSALTGPIIDALLELQQSRAESAETTRKLVDSLIEVPAGGAGQGAVAGDREAILRNLRELDALDAHLLADVQQKLPSIEKAFASLKTDGATAIASNGSLDGVLQDIVRLRDEAYAAGASAVMSFFKGLHSWLSLVARQQISVQPQRFEAVEARLKAAVTMTQQWVDVGRMKKANVEQFLGK